MSPKTEIDKRFEKALRRFEAAHVIATLLRNNFEPREMIGFYPMASGLLASATAELHRVVEERNKERAQVDGMLGEIEEGMDR